MKKYLFLLITCLMLTCTSCNYNRCATYNFTQAQTEVILTKNNYKVIGTVYGESTQNYYFGIGGLSQKSLADDAVSDMYQNADLLGRSRAIINVNVAYKTSWILVYSRRKAVATGILIEFTE